jgi:hypothetical protein
VSYSDFLETKRQLGGEHGFDPLWTPDFLFDFQKSLVEWSIRKGRGAIFADCGLGKTPMQLVWAENVIRRTKGRVLILTPLAVGAQTLKEGAKFGIACERSRDGTLGDAPITVANYEALHKFDPTAFTGIVCDESSILKHFSGATQKAATRFMSKIPHRLLCTATAAPNDWAELGTSSEAIGDLGYTDMLSRFFRQSDNKPHRMETIVNQHKANRFAKLSFRVAQQIGQWRLKGHAEIHFWRWVASWARACRRPSDLGFDDAAYTLPPLIERPHVVKARRPPDGMLFTLPAFGLGEEREERRRTLNERCEYAAELVDHGDQAIIWVQLNDEGNLIEKLIKDSVQVAGIDSEDTKEERIGAFLSGQARVLITKAKIAGLGLNLQQCAHVVTFVTHSYESYYQSVRRCWRFGQTRPVTVDIIATEGEQRVSENMARKAEQAAVMFESMIAQMHQGMNLRQERVSEPIEVPSWL